MSRKVFLRNEQLVERKVVELNRRLNVRIQEIIHAYIPEEVNDTFELSPAQKRRITNEIQHAMLAYARQLEALLRKGIEMAAVVALQAERDSLRRHLGPYYEKAKPLLEALGERMLRNG